MLSFRRFYHLTASLQSVKKQGIKLCKMIEPRNKKRWHHPQYSETNMMPSVKSLTKMQHEPGKRGVRRVAMLNKLFMKQITDIMSTGTVSMDIVGRGIEISKVKVNPDMQTVNVFWVCKGNANDDETEEVLNRVAGALRHELSTLRVMGEVPYIVFVKDKQESHVADLDRRLTEADYGEDYALTDAAHIIKTEFTLDTKLSPEMKAKIKLLEEEVPIIEESLPEMTHNIYGLDHAKIMNRLLAARKKTKDAWVNLDATPVISYRTSDSKIPEPDVMEQRKQLADFLLKRQIMQNKLSKQLKDTRSILEPSNDDHEDFVYDEEVEDDEYYEEEDEYEDTSRFHPDSKQDRPTVR
ncbi:putative ribosome-binding factor A, mitochondrial isoform X1 [Amyelois transitella]|uniref:putative ribosome-binding factor A, mitochondrial isoform X1 n=2 Tax=Amyelois transitella TaxID=680683 RepID=UPI00298F3FF0|nr:putative ribosome-binding factor A, mitochondrial isoform X1 [Amyelois transitella]